MMEWRITHFWPQLLLIFAGAGTVLLAALAGRRFAMGFPH